MDATWTEIAASCSSPEGPFLKICEISSNTGASVLQLLLRLTVISTMQPAHTTFLYRVLGLASITQYK